MKSDFKGFNSIYESTNSCFFLIVKCNLDCILLVHIEELSRTNHSSGQHYLSELKYSSTRFRDINFEIPDLIN